MDKAESKFTNMAKRMDAAMLELLEEKAFNEITVTDVCKAAGAHRSTFYSHYNNTHELLNEVRDDTMRKFYASFEHLPREATFKDREYLDTYLRFIEDHKRLFKIFLENINLFDGFGVLMNLEENMHDIAPANSTQEKRWRHYKLLFIASGITSIVSFWLESGCAESRSELIEIILSCSSDECCFR